MSAADEQVAKVAGLLREAASLHHDTYRISDGDDDDWASWYADWLVRLTELPDVLSVKPVRSELTYLLVKLDGEFRSEPHDEPWQEFYARGIVAHFEPGAR